jgi:hypothetical protein
VTGTKSSKLTTVNHFIQAAQPEMQTTKLLFVVALGLTVLIAHASADGDYHNKDNKGPCKGGFWPDGKGCCPELIHGKPYYRDDLNYCYPKDVGCGVFYADAKRYTLSSLCVHQPTEIS